MRNLLLPLAVGAGLAAAVTLSAAPAPAGSLHDAFNGPRTFAYLQQIVGFGERWPGSPGHAKTEDLIREVLQRDGAQISTDSFTARTPKTAMVPTGEVPVHTIIGKFNVSGDPQQPIFILAGHYDTLFMRHFVGANDGGSSTAILLGFADALAHAPKTRMQIWLVFTDLEEAVVVGHFTDTDGLYGSRHLAHEVQAEGLAPRMRGFFLLDMIGDKDLGVDRETSSSRWLQDFIATAAEKLGYSQYFFQYDEGIIDDQVPFEQIGIPVVDVVDAHFGSMSAPNDGMGAYHHTLADTMDKVSESSVNIVGRTVLLTVELLDAQS